LYGHHAADELEPTTTELELDGVTLLLDGVTELDDFTTLLEGATELEDLMTLLEGATELDDLITLLEGATELEIGALLEITTSTLLLETTTTSLLLEGTTMSLLLDNGSMSVLEESAISTLELNNAVELVPGSVGLLSQATSNATVPRAKIRLCLGCLMGNLGVDFLRAGLT